MCTFDLIVLMLLAQLMDKLQTLLSSGAVLDPSMVSLCLYAQNNIRK